MNDYKSGSYKPIFSKWVTVLLTVLVYGYFIWATSYFVYDTDATLDSTTCNGYGLLIIIFIFITFGILYKLFLKKYFLPHIYSFVWEPTTQLFTKKPFVGYLIRIVILTSIIVFIVIDCQDDWYRLVSLSGLVVFIAMGYLLSPFKKQVPWKTVLSGLIAQFALGLFMIRWETGRNIFICVGDKIDTFLEYAVEASAFVFSDDLVLVKGVVAFSAFAAVYLMSFLINILFYTGVMQSVVLNLGILLQWFLGTSICESVNGAGNIFLGMTEAPFLIKPYLDYMSVSEIHSIMTTGLASVSGSMLAAYIHFGASPVHLITSCVMTAPAALCYSKLMYPEVSKDVVTKDKIQEVKVKFESILDAAIHGADDAAKIVIGIIANLIAFISIVYFINGVISWLGVLVGFTKEGEIWTLELILGKVLIPMTYIMGVEWEDCEKVGQIIGLKSVLNEFVAFQRMQQTVLLERSRIITTYAICGFANPGSVGIMLSTLGVFMPNKKQRLTELVFRAFIGASFSCFMTACVAGVLTPTQI